MAFQSQLRWPQGSAVSPARPVSRARRGPTAPTDRPAAWAAASRVVTDVRVDADQQLVLEKEPVCIRR